MRSKIEQVNLLDRAFHYGDGCFSTGTYSPRTKSELSALHLARLKLSNERLKLDADLNLIEKLLKLYVKARCG